MPLLIVLISLSSESTSSSSPSKPSNENPNSIDFAVIVPFDIVLRYRWDVNILRRSAFSNVLDRLMCLNGPIIYLHSTRTGEIRLTHLTTLVLNKNDMFQRTQRCK